MLANRLWLTAGGLPIGTVFLSHFDSLPLIEETGKTINKYLASATELEPVKFSNGIKFNEINECVYVTSGCAVQDSNTDDFTIEFWLKINAVDMTNGAPALFRAYASDGKYLEITLIRDIPNNRYNVKPILTGAFNENSPFYVYPSALAFLRFYKKGSEYGLIFYQNPYVATPTKWVVTNVTAYTGAPIGSGTGSSGTGLSTTWSLRIGGGGNLIDYAFDEMLLVKGIGNDSTILPTAPY